MNRKPAGILTAAEMREKRQRFTQGLNPGSEFQICRLGIRGGLERTGVSIAWIDPGKESFAYHAHRFEEEWIFIVEGRAVCRIDGKEVMLNAGDFAAFPTPSVPHLLQNPFDRACAYLMGGERREVDVIDYPDIGKTYVLHGSESGTDFSEMAAPIRPFRPMEP